MGQHVSKAEQAAAEEQRQRREGTYGLVQCEGCPERNLVPEALGVCARHQPVHPDAWMVYEPGPDEGYDVVGNL